MVSTRATVFCALQTMQQLAHHFFVTLFHVENVANSCAESNAFNPFVVGSTPAGPTNKTKKGLHICKPFFSFKSLPAPR